MTYENELISIVLPVYNAELWVMASIKSVLEQSFSDFRVYIINDGSTDKTLEIITSVRDDRITIINNPKNIGLIGSLNVGISIAKGRYIARMDADDICLPTRLEKQFHHLEKYKEVSVLGSRAFYLDDNSSFIYRIPYPRSISEINQHFYFRNPIIHPSVLCRTEVIKKYKYADHAHGFEDYDLWLRLLKDGHAFDIYPESLIYYRVRKGSQSNILPYRHVKNSISSLFFKLKIKTHRVFPLETLFHYSKHQIYLKTLGCELRLVPFKYLMGLFK